MRYAGIPLFQFLESPQDTHEAHLYNVNCNPQNTDTSLITTLSWSQDVWKRWLHCMPVLFDSTYQQQYCLAIVAAGRARGLCINTVMLVRTQVLKHEDNIAQVFLPLQTTCIVVHWPLAVRSIVSLCSFKCWWALPLLYRALLDLFPSRTGLNRSKDCPYWKVSLKLETGLRQTWGFVHSVHVACLSLTFYICMKQSMNHI